MRPAFSIVTLIAWALWLGGTIAVFVFGFHFFAAMPREAARESARAVFQAFGPYEGALAGVALLGSIAVLVLSPSKTNLLLVACMVMGGAMVFAHTLGIMHRLEVLHNQGNVGTPEWLRWHIKSMKLMGMQAILLLLTGGVLFQSIRKSGSPSSIVENQPAMTSV